MTELAESHWRQLLDEDEQEFVQAMVTMRTVPAAADMANISLSDARRYARNPKIQTAIALARKSLRNTTNITPSEIAEDLLVIRDMALGRLPVAKTTVDADGVIHSQFVRETNLNAAGKAVQDLGRMLGVFTDKKEITHNISDNQLMKKIENILGVTVDGEFEAVGEKVGQAFESEESHNIKSLAIDTMVNEILSDEVIGDAVAEEIEVRQSRRKKRDTSE